MRILDVTRLVACLWTVVALFGCQKPETVAVPDKVDITRKTNADVPPALWFTTRNLSNGGYLGRFDLKTGAINHTVLPLEKDTEVFADGRDGLFVLTRQFLDSVRILRGPEARVEHYRALPPLRGSVTANAQGVARDSKGRVWVTTMDWDQVLIFSPDLSAQVGSVDLSSLKVANEPEAFADLAQIAALNDHQMVVTAQRFHRATWQPDAQSGMAVIDIETLLPVSVGLVNLVNPIQIFVRDGKALVAGRGDLTTADGARGRITLFTPASRAVDKSEDFAANIIDADFSVADEPPALIAFYPNEKKSCVEIGTKQLACTSELGGYAFGKIKRAGDSVYVSFQGLRDAELWILDVAGVSAPKTIGMKMPIQSLSFGP